MTFLDNIVDDINWRTGQLASLKFVIVHYQMAEEHKKMLIRYSVPSIYSLWEGFVRCSFQFYINEINSMRLRPDDVHISLRTHAFSSNDKLVLENPRINFSTKKEFIETFFECCENDFKVPTKLPTKSNVDFKVISDILLRFNLDLLPESFEKGLKKMLKFRNDIAHGEYSIPVIIDNVSEFSQLVIDLMSEIYDRIEKGYNNKTFLK